MEAQALLDVLGSAASKTWVSSSKAQLGHTLGASGAVEAALTVLALAHGEVPPTVGLVEPELAGLRHVLEPEQAAPIRSALSSSFGFGGMSCVLAFAGQGTPAPPPPEVGPRVIATAAAAYSAAFEPEKQLDPERSRRFDRGSALAAAGAAALVAERPGSGTGLVLGSAFGNVERTMAFLARARERGPRQVAPAEFPHLVPSAPAGNASVYAGLTGPVFSVGDLAQTGEAAFAAGCELIELGAAQRLLVAAIAPRDAIVERVLGPLLEPASFAAESRGAGAGLVLLEAHDGQADGALVVGHYRGGYAEGALTGVPAVKDAACALVLLGAAGSEARALLEQSGWASVARRELTAEHGYHEGLGALALAEAVALLRQPASAVELVLVLSGDARFFNAVLLSRSDGERGTSDG
jgi:3-oxoacyl-[acyl-carrier-protein] synthase II